LLEEFQFVSGAAFFEGAGDLEVVEFAVDLGVAEAAEGEGVVAGAGVDDVADAVAGGADGVEGDGHSWIVGDARVLSDIRGPWSVVSCQLSVVSCQLSVVSCQLSVVSCQLLKARARRP
jgi:hypothetical protein